MSLEYIYNNITKYKGIEKDIDKSEDECEGGYNI